MNATSPPPRGSPPIGDNKPPLDQPSDLNNRLERDHVPLLDEAVDLDGAALQLPERPADDDEAGKLTDWVVKAKGFVKKATDLRVTEKAGYLEGGRIVDAFFGGAADPIEQKIKAITARVKTYNDAKAARELAERRAREAEARAEEERQRAAAREAEERARKAEKEAEDAARRVREAADAKERDEAHAAMLAASQDADAARGEAKAAEKEAIGQSRVADAMERQQSPAKAAALSKISTGGSSASNTKFWNHRIMDADKLHASLGPLGPHLSLDAIVTAIGLLKRERIAAGTISEPCPVPGLEFFEDTRTNIRAARTPV